MLALANGRIGVWSEIVAAAANVSRQSKAQAPIVEFRATPLRHPPVTRTAMAKPMKTSSEAVPPNAKCLNQSIEAAIESSPIQLACSLVINREW